MGFLCLAIQVQKVQINLQGFWMGCGSSVAEKDQIKIHPSALPSSNQASQPQEPTSKQLPPKQQSEPVIPKTSAKPKSPQSSRKQANSKAGAKNQSFTKTQERQKNLNNSQLRSSNIKLTESITAKKGEASPSKGKDDLRSSSLTKSQKSTKIKDESLIKKQANPQSIVQSKQQPQSIIKQQSELKKTKAKKDSQSIKKIKSVKNNKQLQDLIKIYAL